MRHKAAEKILADIAWHVANIVFALDQRSPFGAEAL